MSFNLVTSLTLTGTTPVAVPGQLHTEYREGTSAGEGQRVWIYIQNDTGSDATVGTIMAKAAGVASYAGCTIAATSSDPFKVVGVCQHTLPTTHYGWVLRKGPGFVRADATGYAADVGLILDATTAGCAAAAGDVDDQIFGTSFVAQSGAGATGRAMLNCIG